MQQWSQVSWRNIRRVTSFRSASASAVILWQNILARRLFPSHQTSSAASQSAKDMTQRCKFIQLIELSSEFYQFSITERRNVCWSGRISKDFTCTCSRKTLRASSWSTAMFFCPMRFDADSAWMSVKLSLLQPCQSSTMLTPAKFMAFNRRARCTSGVHALTTCRTSISPSFLSTL